MDMNFDNLLVELQARLNFGTALLAKKGHALGQADFVILAAVAVLGVLLCFFGLKLVRVWAAISALAVGFLGGAYLASYFGLEGYIPFMIGAVVGLILAALGIRFYLAGVFLVSWILGIAGSAYIIQPGDWRFVLICVGIGLVIGLITLKLTEPVMMLASALFGGYAAGQAAYIMLPFKNNLIRIAIIAILVIVGIVIQFLQESRKRKRQHLRKAEEIRNTHSTANEVDKARAMMENFDGQAALEGGKKKSKNAAAKKAEAEVLDLDSIADYDDELDDDE